MALIIAQRVCGSYYRSGAPSVAPPPICCWYTLMFASAETLSPTDPLALLESLLFIASGPTPISRLARTLDLTSAQTESLLYRLDESYIGRGLCLQWSGAQVQLTTAPETSAAVERFLGLESVSRLSQAALEVLAIIAYQQPVIRPQIDQLRGVNSDGALRTLLSKGLIQELGRQESPGRPILYGVTPEFLQHFGLRSLAEMPPLDTPEAELE